MRAIVAAAKYAPDDDEDLDELERVERVHASETHRTYSPRYPERAQPANPWLVPDRRSIAHLPSLSRRGMGSTGHQRRAIRVRMELLGHVDMDTPWEDCPEAIRHVDQLFPDGMSFAEIGQVLGTRKQQVFKIYLRALEKLRTHLGDDVELFLEALRAEPPPTSAWEAIYRAA